MGLGAHAFRGRRWSARRDRRSGNSWASASRMTGANGALRRALGKFKALIRDMTRRTRGISLPQLIKELRPYLIGWRGYFGFCQTPRVLTNWGSVDSPEDYACTFDGNGGTGHNRYKELRRHGRTKVGAAVAAGSPTGFWRMSGYLGGPTRPAQPLLRLARSCSTGVPANRLTDRTAVVRTRMPGGVGGEEPRGSPLSRSIPNPVTRNTL